MFLGTSIKLANEEDGGLVAFVLLVMKKVLTFLASVLGITSALTLRQESSLPPVHLAVSPKCGTLHGTVSDLNAGVNPANFKAIVSFGVC